jgi:hypothetical protein
VTFARKTLVIGLLDMVLRERGKQWLERECAKEQARKILDSKYHHTAPSLKYGDSAVTMLYERIRRRR